MNLITAVLSAAVLVVGAWALLMAIMCIPSILLLWGVNYVAAMSSASFAIPITFWTVVATAVILCVLRGIFSSNKS